MTNQVDVKQESTLTRTIVPDGTEWPDLYLYTMFHLKSNLYYMLHLDHPVLMPLKQVLQR